MKIQLTLSFIFILATGYGQQLTAPAGMDGSSGSYSFSWSIGELVVGTGSGAFVATQGYQQPIFLTSNTLTQTIVMDQTWNIISFYLTPQSLSSSEVFGELVNSGNLIKLQNEEGKSIEFVSSGRISNWVYNFNEIDVFEGFKVKATPPAEMTITGTPISLPVEIPLSAGWNTISFPYPSTASITEVFGTLQSSNLLVKVINEAGKAYLEVGRTGWTVPEFDIVPGEGYKVKVTEATNLLIEDYANKSSSVFNEYLTGTHFTPIWKGNGFDHMNVYVFLTQQTTFNIGDEIGVFDGGLCVGSVTINKQKPYYSIITSRDDAMEEQLCGFSEGNKIILKRWDNQKEASENLTGSFDESFFSVFTTNETAIFNCGKNENGLMISDVEHKITCYPNPFSETLTVDIRVQYEGKYSLQIYNNIGQLVGTLFKNRKLTKVNKQMVFMANNHFNNVSGDYYLVLSSSNSTITKKIIFKKY